MKKLLPILFTLMLLLGSIHLPSYQVHAATTTTIKVKGTFHNAAANEAVRLVNSERAQLGLGQLKLDADLTNTAKQRAAEIAVDFDYSHMRPNGTSYRTVGNKVFVEIICAIYGQSASSAVSVWRNSSIHYNAYTTPSYAIAGAASFTQGGLTYWVMHFGFNPVKPLGSQPKTQEKVMSVKVLKSKLDYNVYYCNTLGAGQTYDITVYGRNKNLGSSYKIEGLKLKYASTNTKVLKVNSAGRMYGIKSGKAKLKITGAIEKTYNVEVYSYYKPKFALDGGSLDAYQAREYTSYLSLRKATKKGYFFKGWYKDSKYKNKTTCIYFGEVDKVYAKWSKVKVGKVNNPSISFNQSTSKLTLKYSKVDKADGYQVYYATDASFKNAQKAIFTKGSYTTPKLTKGKTYYVKVRAYRLDSTGNRVYGAFSKTLKKKVS